MKSDELALNEFEKAVLKLMADQAPTLSSAISELAVSSRELTGVGSFTNFASNQTLVFDTSRALIRSGTIIGNTRPKAAVADAYQLCMHFIPHPMQFIAESDSDECRGVIFRHLNHRD